MVTSESPLTITAEELDARLLEKDHETEALRRRVASMQEQLEAAIREKELFRKRVIRAEAKSPEEVVENFARLHIPKEPTERTCEACSKPLSFCICSR